MKPFVSLLKAVVFCAALSFCSCSFRTSSSFQAPIEVFKAGTEGYHTFRIPGMAVSKAGTILAFAEGRRDHHKDHGDIDLVLRRSTDGGRTWGELIVVRDDGANCCSSPTPVVLDNGRIILLSTGKTTAVPYHYFDIHWYMMYSDDDGLSWSEPVLINEGITEPDWIMACVGPGHAIRLEKGPHKGRLVASCYHKWEGEGKIWQGRSFFIYSDDEGQTWQRGGFATDGGNECMAAELSSGDIMLNMREFKRWQDTTGIRYRRLVAVSRDGGETVEPCRYDENLPSAVCEGSFIRYKHSHRRSDYLLMACPTDVPERAGLKVKLSKDLGGSWKEIYDAPYSKEAYSDMVELPGGGVGIIYEAGEQTMRECLAFDIIPDKAIR